MNTIISNLELFKKELDSFGKSILLKMSIIPRTALVLGLLSNVVFLEESQAQDPQLAIDNECTFGGIGMTCNGLNDTSTCSENEIAKICASTEQGWHCMPACESVNGVGASCALGESCRTDVAEGPSYCQAVPFRMDLNLLDQCI